MTVYYDQDIQSDINGDLVLDSKGDVKIADPLETYKAAALFVLRTDFGDYAPDTTVGCNIGTFVGSTNTPSTRERLESNINSILKNRLFNITDVDATVVPFDIHEVLCLIDIGGSYLIDGVIKTVHGEKVAFTFPFIDGSFIKPLVLD